MELADHASPDLLADKEFMLEIIRASHWEAIFYVAPGLRNDQEVVVEAVRQNRGLFLPTCKATQWCWLQPRKGCSKGKTMLP